MSNLLELPIQESRSIASTPPDVLPVPDPAEDSAKEVPTFRVYKPPTASGSLAALPDDYFNMTPADLKAAQSTMSARTSALTNAPLQVRAVREAAEQAKRDRWPNTTIRVKFSDRTQLERVFLSTDKIKSVYAFVRGCLREDVKPIKFILYQSPPKRDLKVSDPKVRDQTLAQLQLAPSSVLLLRFEDEALNGSNFPAPLLPDILSRSTDLPAPPDFDRAPNSKPQTLSSSSRTESSNAGKKLPKWFKIGQKK